MAPVLLVTAEQSSGAVSWPLALFRVTCLAFKLAQSDFSLLPWHCLSSKALSHSPHCTNVLRDSWDPCAAAGSGCGKVMGENAGKGFPFLLQLFIQDYPMLLPCFPELMWSESFGLDLLLLICFGLCFEDLRAFYKELPLLWKTSRRSWVLEYIFFQKNPKLQSYMTERSAISTSPSFLSSFYCV